ncbi:hypothetical protein K6119_12150 [Paracrocinitomix mangrovi]|uniref:hypothetical protein n=1 Tax=Paracrocinitomix mangrovi TaxID=2862509 RepID=UPI001C8D6F44|nr:hypothetical protein [Paracrocinitomix mangrovi]UKN00483.1 hypothetical protein K6119_12150 [Paracrocinitomix mangrovi]
MKLISSLFFTVISLMSFAQLPSDWMGHFEGELTSVNLAGKTANFHMELDIELNSDSTYNFTLTYGQDEQQQKRSYLLKKADQNHYTLDEQNGIELDMNFGNNRLVSVFEVQGNFLHVSYIKTKKGFKYELSSSKKAKKTGGEKDANGNEIPAVQSYNTLSFQYATLKKTKKK